MMLLMTATVCQSILYTWWGALWTFLLKLTQYLIKNCWEKYSRSCADKITWHHIIILVINTYVLLFSLDIMYLKYCFICYLGCYTLCLLIVTISTNKIITCLVILSVLNKWGRGNHYYQLLLVPTFVSMKVL